MMRICATQYATGVAAHWFPVPIVLFEVLFFVVLLFSAILLFFYQNNFFCQAKTKTNNGYTNAYSVKKKIFGVFVIKG